MNDRGPKTALILEAVSRGRTVAEVARLYGVSQPAVRKAASRAGISAGPRGGKREGSGRKRKGEPTVRAKGQARTTTWFWEPTGRAQQN